MKTIQDQFEVTSKFYCQSCSRYISFVVSFEKRLKQRCPCCNNLLKYKGSFGPQDLRGGNNTAMSKEAMSKSHIALVGEQAHKQLFHDDPIFGQKSEVNETLNEYNAEQARKK
jgi:hypothetical protein